ncbi:MAG: metal ABC transporter permease [Verrucomicrobia bacterium]|nr:metal ABC transporter permease [Verrucomicrobiota bacterium]
MWEYFVDPVLQAPTLGSMLMCLSSALVGVMVVLRKRSLLGEALSHAAYPGVVLSVLITATLFPDADQGMAIAILIGAFTTSLLGLYAVQKLETRLKIQSDAALCLVLSVFFGVGILIASRIQFTHALWYKTIQLFLYGQAATMTSVHVAIYALLALVVLAVLFALYQPIKMLLFDRDFAKTVGLPTRPLDALLFSLLTLAIVIGIRSVGVVLMAGMLIAPAVAARQFTHRLGLILLLAGFFGAVSGFCGNYFSVEIPQWVGGRFSLPTGPMILLSASAICVVSLLFAPKSGLISRFYRVRSFRLRCQRENILKFLWREGKETSIGRVAESQGISKITAAYLLFQLSWQGWISSGKLTKEGALRAAQIVRVHRLWEAYLVFLGQGAEKVHRSAEEMEHIITPELERRLSELLGDPKQDPHAQPIPPKEPTL